MHELKKIHLYKKVLERGSGKTGDFSIDLFDNFGKTKFDRIVVGDDAASSVYRTRIVPSDNQDFDIFVDKTDNFTDKILLIQTVKRDDEGIVPYSYPIKWRLSNTFNEKLLLKKVSPEKIIFLWHSHLLKKF